MNQFQLAYEYIWLRWLNRRPSPACCELLRLLEKRENWVIGPHVMVHKASFIGIWIANGWYGVDIRTEACIGSDGFSTSSGNGNGQTINLSRRDRRAIWKVYKSWHVDRAELVGLYWKLKGHN